METLFVIGIILLIGFLKIVATKKGYKISENRTNKTDSIATRQFKEVL
jgi:hypothetical protein